ncbi:MAG: isoprenyl transferase [Alphaproteobacteria bacterium]|nr:isoprenyl transferase [Alphaproteobacteria bacterium]
MVDGTSINHIAFIMDGNRRWAKKHNMPIAMGHRKGAETLTEIAKAAKNMGVKYMTVYAFSTENWGREISEVNALMDLLRHYLDNGFKELQKNDVRIIFIGEKYMLAEDIRQKISQIEMQTAKNNSAVLCVALSYGSRQEIVQAVREIAKEVESGKLSTDDINVDKFTKFLYTNGIPDPDLVVRTSGEKRISNYLLWQTAYSEFYFSDTLWPDFSKEELEHIIEDYSKRERRYGKS